MISRDGEIVAFGAQPVATISGPDCEALKAALLQKLSGPMARRVMGSVRMMFAHAARSGSILANPARESRVVVARGQRRRVQIPEKPVIRALLEAAATEAPTSPTFTEVWVNLGIFGGARPSEMRGLAIEDLMLSGRRPGAIVRRKADESCILGLTKTENADRYITFGPQVVALLKRWLLALPRSAGLPDPARPGEIIHLVPTSIGTVQTHANITNRMWAPLCKAAGLTRKAKSRRGETILRPRYKLNCLRHIHASLLIEQNMTPKQVQMRMGHSSIQITYDLYGHLFDQRDADRRIGAAIERNLLG